MNLIERLKESFLQHKKRIAFCIEGKEYSYEVLMTHVSRIQAMILKKYPSGGARIGVFTRNDIETYSSLLACWFSNSAYVPLNPHFPEDRLSAIINEAKIEFFLDSANFKYQQDDPSEMRIVPMEYGIESELYVLFTSGSTGVPKGVPITMKNLEAFLLAWSCLKIKVVETDRFLQMFDLTFDVSVACFTIPLLNGGAVYTVSSSGFKYLNIAQIVDKYKLTHITIVPSIISLLKPYLNRLKFEFVRYCILTAEASYSDLIASLQVVMPNAELFNLYGPTEGTIWCTYMPLIFPFKQYNGLAAIGKGFHGIIAIIADENGLEVPQLTKGELLISGEQITKGYLNNLEKNRDSFIEIRSSNSKGRFYRTGDLCYKDEEGDIFYCGRIDNQVKVQGFRVELGEIEFLVRQQFTINNVVIADKNKKDSQELILVLEGTDSDVVSRVQEYLRSKVPNYMIPVSGFVIAEFPLTTSGKIDRIRIRQMISE